MEQNLFSSEGLRVDYFQAGESRVRQLAFTFTPFTLGNDLTLAGTGYGGDFLLKNHYDIIAFKSIRNNWYQDVSPELLAAVEEFAGSFEPAYERRVGYGSSMGAYAAVQFSRALNLDVVLGLSPQFAIDEDFDRRWAVPAQAIEFRHRLDASAISPRCKYYFVYDPETADRLHIDKFRELIGAAQIVEVRTPFSGHPSAHFLAETGSIQSLALAALAGGEIDSDAINAKRDLSRTYHHELSRHLAARSKHKSALALIDRAITMEEKPDYFFHRAIVLSKLDDRAAALAAAHQAVEKIQTDPHAISRLAEIMVKYKDFAGARAAVERAISLDASVAGFHILRAAICAATRDFPSAISAAETGLTLQPENHRLMLRLAWLNIRNGGAEGWHTAGKYVARAVRAVAA